jgi:YidC/Oxa1 family membrane protein insertase
MNPNNENPSFFDFKTIIAVISVALIYFGWQSYLTKKYPNYGKGPSTVVSKSNVTTEAPLINSVQAENAFAIPQGLPEKTYKYENDKVSFEISSLGMGLKKFTINNYEDPNKNKIKIGDSDKFGLFELRLPSLEEPLNFDLVENSPGNYTGTVKLGSSIIRRDLVFNPDTSSFANTITVVNGSEELKSGISLSIPEKIHVNESSSIFFPSYEKQDFFLVHNGGKHESINFSGAKENISKEIQASHVVSVGSQYFAAVVLDKSEIIPNVSLSSDVINKDATAVIVYQPVQVKQEMKFESIFYVGPKLIDNLKAIDPELASIIDFGFFGFIARPLLSVLKFSHSLVGNWGFAIIILTLIVRVFVLPFNIMSFKSMKAMQKIQPAIQAIREKYKEDPVKLNQEMMSIMKENGANPIGGCLPMLLQIPIFFALYQVIGSSVDLYGSPFIGWIHDLSAHDPFYVLPILMSVFMFIQQKITPTTMDPTQAKIMLVLPLVFSLFMLQLPSGLTLYMVVSTLFGILQQILIMKNKTA